MKFCICKKGAPVFVLLMQRLWDFINYSTLVDLPEFFFFGGGGGGPSCGPGGEGGGRLGCSRLDHFLCWQTGRSCFRTCFRKGCLDLFLITFLLSLDDEARKGDNPFQV